MFLKQSKVAFNFEIIEEFRQRKPREITSKQDIEIKFIRKKSNSERKLCGRAKNNTIVSYLVGNVALLHFPQVHRSSLPFSTVWDSENVIKKHPGKTPKSQKIQKPLKTLCPKNGMKNIKKLNPWKNAPEYKKKYYKKKYKRKGKSKNEKMQELHLHFFALHLIYISHLLHACKIWPENKTEFQNKAKIESDGKCVILNGIGKNMQDRAQNACESMQDLQCYEKLCDIFAILHKSHGLPHPLLWGRLLCALHVGERKRGRKLRHVEKVNVTELEKGKQSKGLRDIVFPMHTTLNKMSLKSTRRLWPSAKR